MKIRYQYATCGRCRGLGFIPKDIIHPERCCKIVDEHGKTVAIAVSGNSGITGPVCPECKGNPPSIFSSEFIQ